MSKFIIKHPVIGCICEDNGLPLNDEVEVLAKLKKLNLGRLCKVFRLDNKELIEVDIEIIND